MATRDGVTIRHGRHSPVAAAENFSDTPFIAGTAG